MMFIIRGEPGVVRRPRQTAVPAGTKIVSKRQRRRAVSLSRSTQTLFKIVAKGPVPELRRHDVLRTKMTSAHDIGKRLNVSGTVAEHDDRFAQARQRRQRLVQPLHKNRLDQAANDDDVRLLERGPRTVQFGDQSMAMKPYVDISAMHRAGDAGDRITARRREVNNMRVAWC